MMMPSQPRANLVLCQARFAFGAAEAFFNAVLRGQHPRKLAQRRLERRVGQAVVVLERTVALPLAKDHQCLLGTVAPPDFGLHRAFAASTTSGPFSPGRISICVQFFTVFIQFSAR